MNARRAARVACLLLVSLACACGEDVEAPPGRYAVIARDLRWRDDQPAPTPGRVWRFGSDDAERAATAWTSTGVLAARVDDDALFVEGLDAATLRGPHDLFVDPALVDTLIVTARLEDVQRVELALLGSDGGLAESAPATVADGAVDGRRTFRFPLAGLRGVREGGVAPFELRFLGGHPRVHVVEIAIVRAGRRSSAPAGLHTPFDAPSDESAGQLLRSGALRRGDVLHAGHVARLELPPGPALRRLRVGLAAAGTDQPLDVRLTDPTGRIPPRSVRVVARDGFDELSLDLQPLAGRAGTLELSLADDSPPGAAVLLGSTMLLAPSEDDVPVVILYVIDTLRADRLPLYGYERPTAPHLTAIGEQGVVFEQVVAAASWTRPSISTLLTGLEPPSHGNRRQGLRIDDASETLAETFANAGFVTASFVTNPQGGAWSGLERGFDLQHEAAFAGADRVKSSLTSAAVEGPLAELLREHADERLFVSVHTLDPHRPYWPELDDFRVIEAAAPRPRLIGPEGRDMADASLAYDAEILHNDRMLARLDDELRRLGLFERTLFVLVADHGEAFGEHGQAEHKETLFREELHVPWVLRWPGVLPAGRRLDDVVGLLDVAPTLAAILDIDAPPSWQGRDLSALVRGEVAAVAPTPVLAELLPEDDTRPHLVAAVQWPYKLVCEVRADGLTPIGLYDVRSDPDERVDLARDPSHAAARDALREWIAGRLAVGVASSEAGEIDASLRRWLIEMGYLQDDR